MGKAQGLLRSKSFSDSLWQHARLFLSKDWHVFQHTSSLYSNEVGKCPKFGFSWDSSFLGFTLLSEVCLRSDPLGPVWT